MTERVWTVRVDRTACVGSGICVGRAPGRFVLEGGRSRPVGERVEGDQEVVEAAESCPMEAIEVRDAITGELLAPTD
ncbi:ferredoxin [Allostreptomyces psammosilenae]|uniref:Ferredoxin n=1 Tax=Allostreptomyces psammosilenae TaxID=1892865 RepID=A0A853A2S3_9ACTN|nr:ferredoxin [Allostreptomyces psammosilenae]NYI04812.1 ferredoxin [Allostreptomyces psammosilenae]